MNTPIERDNVLLEGNEPLTTEQKKLFKYFGVNSKIKPPYRILNPHRIHIGDYTSIQEYSHINAFSDLSFLMNYIDPTYRGDFDREEYLYDSSLHIDRECQIGRFFFVSCTNSIILERNVLISERVFLGDNNHSFSHKHVPIMQQPNKKGDPILLKKGTWVGVGASILRGTVLGENCVVSTNSVVDGSFPDYSVIGQPRAQLLFNYNQPRA